MKGGICQVELFGNGVGHIHGGSEDHIFLPEGKLKYGVFLHFRKILEEPCEGTPALQLSFPFQRQPVFGGFKGYEEYAAEDQGENKDPPAFRREKEQEKGKQEVSCGHSAERRPEAVFFLPAGLTEGTLHSRLEAVSYTHLDVYKRQAFYKGEPFIPGNIRAVLSRSGKDDTGFLDAQPFLEGMPRRRPQRPCALKLWRQRYLIFAYGKGLPADPAGPFFYAYGLRKKSVRRAIYSAAASAAVAAAVIASAAAVVVAVAAAAAEQDDDQDDDPRAGTAATEETVVTHN